MMMNRISSKMIVLTALVCLWITPTFSQSIAIQQTPSLVNVGENKPVDLTVIVNERNITDILACNWYKGFSMTDKELIAVFIRSLNVSTTLNGSPATVNENCTLHFDRLTQNDIANYILYAQFKDIAKTASHVINGGAKRFEISSIVLLAAAGLISSFTLF
ncbi:uncharacterized protein LOC143934013 [Lithobates pipiens]